MRSIWFLILLGSLITYHCLTTVAGEEAEPSTDAAKPTAEQCKGFVDEALKTASPSEETEGDAPSTEDSEEPPDEAPSSEDVSGGDGGDSKPDDEESTSQENEDGGNSEGASEEDGKSGEDGSQEATAEEKSGEDDGAASEEGADNATNEDSQEATEEQPASAEDEKSTEDENATSETTEGTADDTDSQEASKDVDASPEDGESNEATAEDNTVSKEGDSGEEAASAEQDGVEQTSAEEPTTGEDDGTKSEEDDKSTDGDTQEDTAEETKSDGAVQGDVADQADQSNESGESQEGETAQEDQASAEDAASTEAETGVKSEEGDSAAAASQEGDSGENQASNEEAAGSQEDSGSEEDEEEQEEVEPYEPRSRAHVTQILGLDDSEETKNTFTLLDKVTTSTLKELKSTYENAIKPLEHLYKYRDLSNRHFGDPEIFSKPLIVFMGPWSGGKSTIINWLLGIQHDDNALRTGADPSPAQFNIMMYGKEPEKLDGTQLAADWTFSGLQKFGQSFLDRLRGQRLPNRLLEKVNIVEIPGILEVRKQVERSFPFNDACQWFIDRADTLFLIYDPAKLDIGPETEAILDQLKGRENQVRIVLNKADTVKPDELMRVQAMLVWNISPLMSSAEPPVLYAASLWDRPLQVESPKSLLVAHENSFLKDIREGIERRVETRIAAARRFAVRVRNHAKMVDCYLNTFNNHRSFFGDRKKISTDIIDHPQNYHIYEGLSTLTNISRYDLPDPETYRDFFRLNPIWDFPTLQSTCSFWRGCPLHKLDIAIAYDLPEILGKFRRQREAIVSAKQAASSKK